MIDDGFKHFGKNIQSSPKDEDNMCNFKDDYDCISSKLHDEYRIYHEKTSTKEPKKTKQKREKPLENTRNRPVGSSRLKPWKLGFPVSFYSASTSTSPNSALSRKHSRDGTMLFVSRSSNDARNGTEAKKFETSKVMIRKTLRVNDPIEAANSSIWTTLRIEKNNNRVRTPTVKRGIFGGVQVQQFNGNGDNERRNNVIVEASSMVAECNPAAFSRSLSFHEIAR
ncbi:hypothetical protein RND81_11G041600 [Saponaria officinalis]|uniref:Uncharacterized protein n=1 Tax=Saponaria officinalis TaxID=3572 RepID=A0AAW1HHT2_SAPOF